MKRGQLQSCMGNFDEIIDIDKFSASHPFVEHPIMHAQPECRKKYFTALNMQCAGFENTVVTLAALSAYRNALDVSEPLQASNIKASVKSIWRKKCGKFLYRRCLIADLEHIAWLNGYENLPEQIYASLQEQLGKLRSITLKREIANPLESKYPQSVCRTLNINSLKLPRKRIALYSTMSSGKSTIINAIAGKTICKTMNEACSDKVHYVYGKPLEDGCIHEFDDTLSFMSGEKSFSGDSPGTAKSKADAIYHAAYLDMTTPNRSERMCFIETPGADSERYKEHSTTALNLLSSCEWDLAIYVINFEQINKNYKQALDAFLKVVGDKDVMFVINKVDSKKPSEDDIDESISRVVSDLVKLGIEKPIVCPISARTALLAKRKARGYPFSKYDEIDLEYYSSKFASLKFDLSKKIYHWEQRREPAEIGLFSECDVLLEKCGFAGFERHIVNKLRQTGENQ